MKKKFRKQGLELIYTQLSLLNETIADFEYQAAMRAHAMLLENLSSPPSLVELAQKAG